MFQEIILPAITTAAAAAGNDDDEEVSKVESNKEWTEVYHKYQISLFVNVTQIHSHGTRQQLQMYNKSSRTNVKSMSVSVFGVNMWNALHNEIKLCDNFSKYKYQLKQFYVNKYTTV